MVIKSLLLHSAIGFIDPFETVKDRPPVLMDKISDSSNFAQI